MLLHRVAGFLPADSYPLLLTSRTTPNQCQLGHWKSHKLLCKHIKANRPKRLHSSELGIRPWTKHTAYEQKDADFTKFERAFEKVISRFANKHSKGNTEAGVVCVDVSKQKKPLNLWWCPIEKFNTPGMPHFYGDKRAIANMKEEIRQDTLKVYPKTYVCMAAWGGQKPIDWFDCPINYYSHGGRGSTQYTGPAGFNAMAHECPDTADAYLKTIVKHP